MLQHRTGDKARALSVDVSVTCAVLAMRKEALRHHEVKLVLGPRHGDIQPARIEGQREMLLPITGKKGKEAAKPEARTTTRQKKAG